MAASDAAFWRWYDTEQVGAVRFADTIDVDNRRVDTLREAMRRAPANSLAGFVIAAHSLLGDVPVDRRADLELYRQHLDTCQQRLETASDDLAFLTTRRWSRFRFRFRWWPPTWVGSRRGPRWPPEVVASATDTAQQRVDSLVVQVIEAGLAVTAAEQSQQGRARWHTEHAEQLTLGVAAAIELDSRADQALEGLARQAPAYLVNLLGPPPVEVEVEAEADLRLLDHWKAGARLVEVFRATHDVRDPDHALGAPPARGSPQSYNYAVAAGELARVAATIQPAMPAAAPEVEPEFGPVLKPGHARQPGTLPLGGLERADFEAIAEWMWGRSGHAGLHDLQRLVESMAADQRAEFHQLGVQWSSWLDEIRPSVAQPLRHDGSRPIAEVAHGQGIVDRLRTRQGLHLGPRDLDDLVQALTLDYEDRAHRLREPGSIQVTRPHPRHNELEAPGRIPQPPPPHPDHDPDPGFEIEG